jgi:hypothetical protein
MKRPVTLLAVAAMVLLPATPRVPRGSIANIEKAFDSRLRSFDINDPIDMLGTTRGVYLEGYGVVFTNEVGLVVPPAISPFHPTVAKEDVGRLRARKLARVPQVKKLMRDMMVHAAYSLREVPLDEQVAVGLLLSYAPWEDSAGLPREILMEAQRKTLVDFEAGRIAEAGLNAVIKIREN